MPARFLFGKIVAGGLPQADPQRWENKPMITGKTQTYAILGDPIEQALSQLEAKPGDVFLWQNCWYDPEWPEHIGRAA